MKSISRPVIDRLPVNQLDNFACRQLDKVSPPPPLFFPLAPPFAPRSFSSTPTDCAPIWHGSSGLPAMAPCAPREAARPSQLSHPCPTQSRNDVGCLSGSRRQPFGFSPPQRTVWAVGVLSRLWTALPVRLPYQANKQNGCAVDCLVSPPFFVWGFSGLGKCFEERSCMSAGPVYIATLSRS